MSDSPKIEILDYPPKRNQSAEKLWAFICRDSQGNESPCGMETAMGWTAMITSEWRIVERLRPVVRKLAKDRPSFKFILRQYAESTDLEEL